MFSDRTQVKDARQPVGPCGVVRATLVLATWASLVAFVSPTVAADLKWNDAPVVGYARVAPLDRLQRDLSFLGENVDGGKSIGGVKDAIMELSAGIDAARPAGLVVYADDSLNIVAFVPLKDEEKLFAALRSRFGWEFRRGDDGIYRGGNVNVAARVSGSWLFVTGATHAARLSKVPEDPMRLFEGLDPTVTAQAGMMLDQLPAELRKTFDSLILESCAPAQSGAAAGSSSTEWIGPLTKQLLSDTRRWEFELQCLRPVEQFHVTSRLVPVKASKLESWIEAAAQRPSMFEHLASENAAAAIISSLALDAATIEPLLRAWDEQAAKARAAAPSPESPQAELRALGVLVAQTLEAVTTTLRKGELDGGVVLERQGQGHLNVLAGGTLYGSRAIQEKALEVAQMLQPQEGFRALNWAVSQNGDVSLNQLQLPMKDENARRIFGESLYVVIGFGPDRLYSSLGDEEAIGKLSLAVDRSREDRPSRGEPLRVTLRMAPFTALLNDFSDKKSASDGQIRSMAEQIAPYKKNDTLAFTVRAGEGALESRLRIDMGVLRMLASSIPKPGAPPRPETGVPTSPPAAGGSNLALRPAPGDRFQIQFDTDSEVKTKIDAAERVDQGKYSTLYDFRVLEARPDGAVRLEAVLKRAIIKKTGADGNSSFDSAAKGAPEKMTAETVLYAAMVDEPFQMTVAADGSLGEFGGLAEAVQRMVDNKLQPPANERAQAQAFVEQSFNANALRDSLGRAFEFYPGKSVSEGDRWSRTTENFSGIDFFLDNKYQLKSLAASEAVISVRAQVREKEADAAAPIRWEVLGTQTGTIKLRPQDGRLLSSEYVLKFDAEATLKMDGKTVVRPVTSTIKMTIGPPAAPAAGRAAVGNAAERELWRHAGGHFADHGSGNWVERSQNGSFDLQEVERSPQHIELVSKSGTGTRVRLFAGQSDILRRGQGPWTRQYNGDWAAAPAAEQRVFWSHPQGFFDQVAEGKWLERSANGAFHFVEAARTDDYVELRNMQTGTLVRLFGGRCELKGEKQSEFTTRYQGEWKAR
ncbi:MAG: hypothetical protein K8U03_14235 [Planctomycetia bacterium]|nr:hypothetical protein [Planctomycetia bacterium]